jgi:serine/threonine protein kinase
MSTLPPKLHLFPHSSTIKIGDSTYTVEKTLGFTGDTIVSQITIDDEPWAVKTSRYPNAVRLGRTFEKEMKNIKAMANTEFRRFLPTLLDGDLRSYRTVAIAMKPVGEDLYSYCLNAEPGTEFAPLFVKVVDALQCLHKCKWYHGDFRLQNVIVFNNEIYIIDFETTAPCETKRNYMLGTYCFMAKNMLLNNAECFYSTWDNMESFAYNLLLVLEGFKSSWARPISDPTCEALQNLVDYRETSLNQEGRYFDHLRSVVNAIQTKKRMSYVLLRQFCQSFPAAIGKQK